VEDLREVQLRPVLPRGVEDLRRRALLHDDAVIEEDHPVRDRAREAHLVGDAEHRHARLGELAHDVEDLADHLRVEGRRRLVEEHDLGLHREGAGDRDPLLLAARQLGRVLLRLLRDADALEELHRGLLGPVARPLPDLRRRQHDVLEDGEVGEEVERLEDHPDLAADRGDVADVVRELDAVDDDLAALVLLEPVDRADEGRLAGARGTEDDDDLALLDVHADAAQDVELAEPLVDVAGDDDALARGRGGGIGGRRRGRGCLVSHGFTSRER
jgi:hypothetical protein